MSQNHAELIGTVHRITASLFQMHDAILAVDIGGTNIRAGVVHMDCKRSTGLSAPEVWQFDLWRHRNEKLGRDEAVKGLIDMLKRLIARAHKADKRLAPFIGVGCPGSI
jgi:predicted NBD/HSP70 family sugar kinase